MAGRTCFQGFQGLNVGLGAFAGFDGRFCGPPSVGRPLEADRPRWVRSGGVGGEGDAAGLLVLGLTVGALFGGVDGPVDPSTEDFYGALQFGDDGLALRVVGKSLLGFADDLDGAADDVGVRVDVDDGGVGVGLGRSVVRWSRRGSQHTLGLCL